MLVIIIVFAVMVMMMMKNSLLRKTGKFYEEEYSFCASIRNMWN